MKRKRVIGVAVVVVLLVSLAAMFLLDYHPHGSIVHYYVYEIVNAYPHDTNAFTQGLVFDNGMLYESTGLNGYSSLRCVKLETGEVLQYHALASQFFGEGLTVFGDAIIQLTWQSNTGFVYDKNTFDLLGTFFYPTEGWGLTNNGTHLIMSDGTPNLYFLDPETFIVVDQVSVHDSAPVGMLNELEYIDGEVYANIWKEERIVIIDPKSGQVTGWIDLSGICGTSDHDANNVLNGIAHDLKGDRLFVTGKRWPTLFEIKLERIR